MSMDNQKGRETVNAILHIMDFDYLHKDFHRLIMAHLEIEETKFVNKSAIVDKIVGIYENYKNQFEKYLTLPKFKHINSEVKDFLWTVFKQYDEKNTIRKLSAGTIPLAKPSGFGREAPPYVMGAQSMNMNMVNMFMDVPNLQTVDEIETFQRKMFEIYKTFMPQVINSMSISSNSASQFYRQPNYQNYGMGAPLRQADYFDQGSSFNNRFYPLDQRMGGLPKNYVNDFRISPQYQSPSSGFNIYHERNNQIRPPFSQQKLPNILDEHDRKYIYSQKNISSADSFRQYSPHPVSERDLRVRERERYYSPLEVISRKMYKKDVETHNEVEKPQLQKAIKCSCKDPQEGSCIYCSICNLNPFSEVEEVLCCSFLDQRNQDEFSIVINPKQVEKVAKSNRKLDIQIRSISPENVNEIAWPHSFKLAVNSTLCQLSSKKSKPFMLWKQLDSSLPGEGSIKIEFVKTEEEGRIKKDVGSHLIGVFIVKEQSVQKMYDKIMKSITEENISSYLQPEEVNSSKDNNNQSDRKDNESSKQDKDKVSQKTEEKTLRISTYHPGTKQLIKDPVRGRNCAHPQCFDLKSFLTSLMSSPNRQWKCPVCSVQAKKFVIDTEVKSILADIGKMIKVPESLQFYPNGAHVYVYEDESSDHELNENNLEGEKESQKNSIRQNQEKRPHLKTVILEQPKLSKKPI